MPYPERAIYAKPQPGAPYIDSDVWDVVRRTTALSRNPVPVRKVVILRQAKTPRI